jgi:undecaprenyl-diphosphatase
MTAITTTIDVVYPIDSAGKRLRMDPFSEMPSASKIARTSLVGFAVLVAWLTVTGLLLTSTSPAEGALRWDESVSVWLADARSGQFVRIANWFSKMADTKSILAIMATVTIVLAVLRKWRAMLLLPLAMLIEITTFLSVNYLVGRPRPDVSKIGPIPGTYSFPSGHVAATFVCWFAPALLLYAFGHLQLARVVSAIGAVVTVLTGWGRVYLGMHHTVDVVMGLLMGIAALTIAARATRMQLQPEPEGGHTTTVPETVAV